MISLDAFLLRPRLVLSFAVAAILGFLLPGGLTLGSKCLVAWCVGVCLYMVMIIWEMSRASVDRIRERASQLDDSAPVILVISMVATMASFGGIADILLAPANAFGSKVTDIVLGGGTMVLSWFFMQIVFAVHYTHIFYGDVNGIQRGGLQFGGEDGEPDFWDFLYFTTSIGATAQTSDTVVGTKTMRRIVTAQAVYSFFFNTTVLALAINVAAGLAGH